jgi:hypothetical protein
MDLPELPDPRPTPPGLKRCKFCRALLPRDGAEESWGACDECLEAAEFE